MLSVPFQGMFWGGFLTFFGQLVLLYATLKLVYGCYSFVYEYFTPSVLDFKSFGKWAVVTGSTDGIGKGMAFELAKRGLSILLVSRNPEKLEKVSQEIEEKFNVETKCVSIDFSCSDEVIDDGKSSMYDVIAKAIETIDVGVLVNNVGMGAYGEFLNAFSKSDNKNVSSGIPRLIYCNDLSMTMVTALILEQMVSHGRGLVINISSLAATLVMPKSAIYSGSKKYNDTFTKGLSQEYKSSGIVFQSVQPGVVKTNMTSKMGNAVSYQTYAAHTMNALGKGIVTTGYYKHGLLKLFLSALPEFILCILLLKR